MDSKTWVCLFDCKTVGLSSLKCNFDAGATGRGVCRWPCGNVLLVPQLGD